MNLSTRIKKHITLPSQIKLPKTISRKNCDNFSPRSSERSKGGRGSLAYNLKRGILKSDLTHLESYTEEYKNTKLEEIELQHLDINEFCKTNTIDTTLEKEEFEE